MSQIKRFFWPVVCGTLLSVVLIQQYPHLVGLPSATVQDYRTEHISFANAVSKATPSVVNIYTATKVRDNLPQRRPSERTELSLGSGIIMDAAGYILTNFHVINGADQILVMLYDGREALARVIGVDPDTDLAVLKVELNNLIPISLGNPNQARVGDVVLAIGNPYGFGHSVSQGIISATGRYNLKLTKYENYIQTDATINRGNSGGALTDTDGNLLGINSALFNPNSDGSDGIGLAIPADTATHIMQSIIMNGSVVRGWMGVEVEQMRPNDLKSLGLNQGLLITGLSDGGPAAQAGLKEGDIITHINGRLINDARAAMNRIALSTPGQGVDVEYIRGGIAYHTEIVVGTRPNSEG